MKKLKLVFTSLLIFCLAITMNFNVSVFAIENPNHKIESVQVVKEQFAIDFKLQIAPRAVVTEIVSLEIDGVPLEKATSKYSIWGSSTKFYIDESEGQLYTSTPSKNARYTFYGTGSTKLGDFIYHHDTKIFEKVSETDSSEPEEGNEHNDEESDESGSSDAIAINTMDTIVETPSNGIFDFDPYSVTVTPSKSIENLNGVEVGTKKLREVTSKATVFGDVFYVDRDNGKIYFGDKVRMGSVITFKDGEKILGKFRKVDDVTYEKVDTEALTTKDLHVRLRGSFESALVNQKKYDAVSSASSMASVNKNSNVIVELAETEKNSQPQESDWKLVKDSTNIHLEFKSTALKISDLDMGMTPIYNTYDSSVTLSGTPKKAGRYNVTVTVTDSLGRVAKSNELPFTVYNLNDVKLVDQLKEEYFQPFESGGRKLQWDMEPWYIEKFGTDDKSEPSEVQVPASLKLWHGSHESGVYGVLGYAVEQDQEPHQTLIIGRDTSLTLKHMKVLSSVNILVKDGGKLNFYDSSLYGRITVENGGKLQINYDEIKQEYSTGSSINGQIILKDGALLESSIIYSNANHLTDSRIARRIVWPVIKVLGNVTVEGKIYLRGDDSATGKQENGNDFTGQPAMSLEEGAILNIPENSELGVYGGGRWAFTSTGGDGLILKKGSQVTGDGKLIAIGGTGRSLKGGDGISGTGSINVKEAFLQGGNNFSESSPVGKAYTENVVISPKTIGYAKDGKHNPTTEEEANSPYWKGLKAPGVDNAIANPLDFSKTEDAPKILNNVESIPYEIEYISDDSLDKGEKRIYTKGKNGLMENGEIKEHPIKEVVKVGVRPTVKTVEIPFDTVRIDNNSLRLGTELVKTEGVNGKKTITTTYRIDEDGNVFDNQIYEKVIIEKVDKVIEIGTKPIEKNALEIIETGEVDLGKEFRVRISSEPENLNEVYLDDKLLKKEKDYKVEKGSTVILIGSSVINSLDEGEHNLVANFNESEDYMGGSVALKFNVPKKTSESTEIVSENSNENKDNINDTKLSKVESKKIKTLSNSPKTGDERNFYLYISMLVLAIIIVLALGKNIKRKI